MQDNNFFELFNDIDEKFIEEAQDISYQPNCVVNISEKNSGKKRIFKITAAIAACLAVVCTATVISHNYFNGIISANPASPDSDEDEFLFDSASDFEYHCTDDGSGIILTRYSGDKENVVIPRKIDDKPVVGLEYTFSCCNNVKSIEIPDTVVSMSGGLLNGTLIEKIVIPASVESLHNFGRAYHLKEIIVDANNPNYRSVDNVVYTKDMSALVAYPCDKEGTEFTVPDSVTVLEGAAFFGSINLETINLPDNLEEIGDCAFESTENLKEVYIPASVKSIGEGAFSDSQELQSIAVDENNEIYSSVDGVLFNKDQSLLIKFPDGITDEYTVPDSVCEIEEDAFKRTSLSSLIVSDSVSEIGDQAFAFSDTLEYVKLPDGLTEICANGLFTNDTALKTVDIPDSVTRIEWCTFDSCSSLSQITLPDGLIGDAADSEGHDAPFSPSVAFFDCPDIEITYRGKTYYRNEEDFHELYKLINAEFLEEHGIDPEDDGLAENNPDMTELRKAWNNTEHAAPLAEIPDYCKITGSFLETGGSSICFLPAEAGEDIFAVDDGEVIYVGNNYSCMDFDNNNQEIIIIKHSDGVYTIYQTVDASVETGDSVERGQIIGRVTEYDFDSGFDKPRTGIIFGIFGGIEKSFDLPDIT